MMVNLLISGILQSDNSNNETLNSVLNLLLHYYRHNLGEVRNTPKLT